MANLIIDAYNSVENSAVSNLPHFTEPSWPANVVQPEITSYGFDVENDGVTVPNIFVEGSPVFRLRELLFKQFGDSGMYICPRGSTSTL